ncbi:integrator complex subunit 9-like [Teleopsis dalmanni]|nr:integrator complex subunit 9-like [Teleopsis dalmanni]
MWGNNPNNSIIFTEPDFPYIQALAPFQPLAMKAFYCPIDTSLNYQQANKLIKELKPNVLVIPEAYVKPLPNAPNVFIDQPDKKVMTFKCGDIIRLPLKRKMERIYLNPDVSQAIAPLDVGNGYSIASLTGFIEIKDKVHNVYDCTIESDLSNGGPSTSKIGKMTSAPIPEETLKKEKILYGTLDSDTIIKCLTKDGFKNIKMERLSNTVSLILNDDNATIKFEDNESNIICDNNATRRKISESMKKCFQSF